MTSPRMIAMAVCLGVALAGCSGNSGPEAIPTSSTAPATVATTRATTTEIGVPASTAGTPAAGCDPADLADVATIDAALTGDMDHLGEAYTITTGNDRYIGANIYDTAGDRASSSDVWVVRGGDLYADDDSAELYALSGGARDLTLLPEGRDLGLSAGDDIGTAVQACVQG